MPCKYAVNVSFLARKTQGVRRNGTGQPYRCVYIMCGVHIDLKCGHSMIFSGFESGDDAVVGPLPGANGTVRGLQGHPYAHMHPFRCNSVQSWRKAPYLEVWDVRSMRSLCSVNYLPGGKGHEDFVQCGRKANFLGGHKVVLWHWNPCQDERQVAWAAGTAIHWDLRVPCHVLTNLCLGCTPLLR
eukprot:scaffold311157_cov23-Tisochrysis_lutea.AAC.2